MGGCNIGSPIRATCRAVFSGPPRAEVSTASPAVNTLFSAMAHHPDFGTVDWNHLAISVGGGMVVTSGTLGSISVAPAARDRRGLRWPVGDLAVGDLQPGWTAMAYSGKQ